LGDNGRCRVGSMGGQGQSGREKQRNCGYSAHVEADRRGTPENTAGALPTL